MEIITAVKGFKDILPEEVGRWRYIEDKAREIFGNFGLREIRVPVLEKTELFKRSIGEVTDIVEKEMYSFTDRGGERLTLRPEATASVIRAYLQHSMHAADPVAKLFTIGPMFRRERPQKGRFRQFHQINVELIGMDDPRADAELILILITFLRKVRLSDIHLEINSLGCFRCRPSFRQEITGFFRDRKDALCGDCLRRLETNPLRVFDCKVESCRQSIAEAPELLDYICPECLDHFEKVKEYLTAFDIPFKVNAKMVRGLDYYTKTAFEVSTGLPGSQNAVAGGGRYDSLIKELGGPDIPGAGFAVGFERLLSLLSLKDEELKAQPLLYIASLGDEAGRLAYILCNQLRILGIWAEMDYSGRSLKSQMRRSSKLNSSYTLILGEREIRENRAELRDMKKGTQQTLSLDNIDNIIKCLGR